MLIDPVTDIIARLTAATIAGGIIGLNRELKHESAGLRTHALVALGAALATALVAWSLDAAAAQNIDAMSRVEDLIVIEDMATQPRVLPDGSTVEYGPVYEMLHAIAHGKPIVATVLADGDYHTPPNLMRLAIIASPCDWPMTRRLRISGSFSTVSTSSATILPTGIPVQSDTTEATACSSTCA